MKISLIPTWLQEFEKERDMAEELTDRLLTDEGASQYIDNLSEDEIFSWFIGDTPKWKFVSQAQDAKTLKAVGELLEKSLDKSWAIAYLGPETLRVLIDQLKQGKMPE